MADQSEARYSDADLSSRSVEESTKQLNIMNDADELEASSSAMPRARAIKNSDTVASAQFEDEADDAQASTPTKTTLSKAPSTSTPKSKKRKSRRSSGYADESDSDYRAPPSTSRKTSSRKTSSRKPSRRSSFSDDPDGEYGGSKTPTRKMTRPIKTRYSHRSTIDESESDSEEDEREGLCLETCDRFETSDMLVCDGMDCGGRKFHPACVGFRVRPVLGEGRWWFCFGCRKVEGKGMWSNGVFVEGEGDEDGGE